MPLTGVNWASRPTVKLVTDINGGPGPASSIEAGAAWRALSTVLSEADDDFTSATKLAMGNWEGPAADSARTALMPFSEWATAAGTIAHQLSAQTTAHGDAFSAAKVGMPSLPEVLATEAIKDNIVDKTVSLLTGVPTPGEVAEVVAAEQQTQSALAMMSYDVTSSTLTTYTPFMPAPILTAEVVPTSAAVNTVTYGHLGQHHAQDYASTMTAGASGSASGSASATNGGSVDGGHWAATGGSGATHATGSTASGSGPAGLGSGSGSVGTSFTGGSHSVAAGLGAGDSGAAGAGPTRTPSASGSFARPGLAGAGIGSAGLAGAGGAGRFGSSGGLGGSGASSGSVASASETASRSSLSAGAHSSAGAAGDSSARGLASASDSAATRGRGGVGSGMGTGAGLGNSEDDQEHEIPDYLKDLEHFSDGRVVAPPVIGVDDAL